MRNCPNYRCKQCDELGHSESRCPTIECFNCHRFGHKSFNCTEYEEDYEQETMEDQQDNETTRESDQGNNDEVQNQPDFKGDTIKDSQVTDQATGSNLDTGESETSIAPGIESEDLPKQRHGENSNNKQTKPADKYYKTQKENLLTTSSSQPARTRSSATENTRMKRAVSTDEVYTIPKKLTSQQKKTTQPAIEKTYNFRTKEKGQTGTANKGGHRN
ncbi:hypothetical protein BSL78_07120 [Apostichopus japonicus]|uniref:CCHC-type domain-containing protein n=1 Tax=Stichopus japonicus TaxID=307972 RepID=A0A2G8L6T7_STIJA|nr:hypothetical protein BSL78_07120 [Apostichopus japonicus]